WDHSSDPDAFFHLPFSFGPLWASQDQKFSHNSFANGAVTQSESADMKRSYPGVFFNISFDFLFWKKLAIMPSFLGFYGFTDSSISYDYVVTKNGVTTTYSTSQNGADPFYGNGQVAVMYRP